MSDMKAAEGSNSSAMSGMTSSSMRSGPPTTTPQYFRMDSQDRDDKKSWVGGFQERTLKAVLEECANDLMKAMPISWQQGLQVEAKNFKRGLGLIFATSDLAEAYLESIQEAGGVSWI